MKVLRQNSSELTLQHSPWWIWMMGGIFVLMGGLPLLFLGQSTLTCQRSTPTVGTCQLVKGTLFRHQVETFALQDLTEARVETRSARRKGGRRRSLTYQILLVTRDREIPLKDYYSSGDGQLARANRINQFRKTPSLLTLSETEDDRPWALGFLALFSSVGVGTILVFGQKLTYEFNRTLGLLAILRQGVIGTKHREHSLQNLAGIRIECSSSSKSKNYRVALVYENGESVPMTFYYSSGRAEHAQTASQIGEFLKLPILEE